MDSWWLTIGMFGLLGLWLNIAKGPKISLGVVVLLSLLFPTWYSRTFWGFEVNLRIPAVMIGMGYFIIHPRGVWPRRLILADFALAALALTNLVSDVLHGEDFGWTFARGYCEWVYPCVAGRFAIQSMADVKRLTPYVAAFAIACGMLATFESVAKVNPLEAVYGERPLEMAGRDAARFGFKRAYGPTKHAIFFGALQLFLMPWCLLHGLQAVRGDRSLLGVASAVLNGMGVASSVSRAPIACLAMVPTVAAFVGQRSFRPLFIGGGVLGLAGVFFAGDQVLGLIDKLADEPYYVKQVQIEIDGQKKEFSSARIRYHMIDMYGPAMRQGGWLGYGTTRVTGFPPDVPLAVSKQTLDKIATVENALILMTLRLGWLGLFLFCAWLVCLTGSAVWLGATTFGDESLFASLLAGLWVATLFLINTVWMAFDFGFLMIWTAGVTCSLVAAKSALVELGTTPDDGSPAEDSFDPIAIARKRREQRQQEHLRREQRRQQEAEANTPHPPEPPRETSAE